MIYPGLGGCRAVGVKDADFGLCLDLRLMVEGVIRMRA